MRPIKGRTPPHDLDAEEALLGAMLLSAAALDVGLGIVGAGDFYKPAHGYIVDAIAEQYGAGEKVDPVSVAAVLRARGTLEAAGGIAALSSLQANTPSTSAAGTYARIVAEHARRRRMIGLAAEIAEAAYGHDDDGVARAIEAAGNVPASGRPRLVVEDVAAAIEGKEPPIEPTILCFADGDGALIYPGCINAIYSEPSKGKSWLALVATAQLLEAGERVVYLDYEGNRRIVGARLAALGVTPECAERLAYLRPGKVGMAERAALVELTAGAALVVIDGMAKSLAQQGLSEDKAPDVLAWMDLLCWPLTELGAAVLLLDHVIKDKEHQGRWARGSSAKLGEIDGASYRLEGGKFSREKAGRVRLVLTKDREGAVGAEGETVAHAHFTPGSAERLGVRLERPGAGEDGAAAPDGWLPTELMDRVLVYFAAHPDERLTKTALAAVIRGRRAYLWQGVDALVADGRLERGDVRGHEVFGLPQNLPQAAGSVQDGGPACDAPAAPALAELEF